MAHSVWDIADEWLLRHPFSVRPSAWARAVRLFAGRLPRSLSSRRLPPPGGPGRRVATPSGAAGTVPAEVRWRTSGCRRAQTVRAQEGSAHQSGEQIDVGRHFEAHGHPVGCRGEGDRAGPAQYGLELGYQGTSEMHFGLAVPVEMHDLSTICGTQTAPLPAGATPAREGRPIHQALVRRFGQIHAVSVHQSHTGAQGIFRLHAVLPLCIGRVPDTESVGGRWCVDEVLRAARLMVWRFPWSRGRQGGMTASEGRRWRARPVGRRAGCAAVGAARAGGRDDRHRFGLGGPRARNWPGSCVVTCATRHPWS